MREVIKTACGRAMATVHRFAWIGPLLVRLTVGLVFVVTGWGKLHSLANVTQFFDSLHIPAPHANAVFVSSVELVGGLLLIAGLGARIAALLLAGVMTVALVTAKLPDVHGIVDLAGTLEFVFLTVFIWLLAAGPGSASLDHLITPPRAPSEKTAAPV